MEPSFYTTRDLELFFLPGGSVQNEGEGWFGGMSAKVCCVCVRMMSKREKEKDESKGRREMHPLYYVGFTCDVFANRVTRSKTGSLLHHFIYCVIKPFLVLTGVKVLPPNLQTGAWDPLFLSILEQFLRLLLGTFFFLQAAAHGICQLTLFARINVIGNWASLKGERVLSSSSCTCLVWCMMIAMYVCPVVLFCCYSSFISLQSSLTLLLAFTMTLVL